MNILSSIKGTVLPLISLKYDTCIVKTPDVHLLASQITLSFIFEIAVQRHVLGSHF